MIISFLLGACEQGNSKFAGFSDKKVAKEYRYCKEIEESGQRMGQMRAVACTNYEQECERRKKKGKDICH